MVTGLFRYTACLLSLLDARFRSLRTECSATGRESGNGEQVAAFDLDDGEWVAFSDGIARLAAEQVQPLRVALQHLHGQLQVLQQ